MNTVVPQSSIARSAHLVRHAVRAGSSAVLCKELERASISPKGHGEDAERGELFSAVLSDLRHRLSTGRPGGVAYETDLQLLEHLARASN
ncbi:MAG: hypothetical protein WD696_17175 [Bryobacteraceae bacterium]